MFVLIFACSIVLAWYVGSWKKSRLESITQRLLGTPKETSLGVDANGEETSEDQDEVYPVHSIDQATIVRTSICSYTFRYDVVLDAQKLHDSLALLLSSGDWRKLGGRLRENKNGKLEVNVPRNFSNDRPPFRFSHVKFDVTMEEHPLASRLPKKTDRPSIQEGCRAFREFSLPSTLPNDMKHYLSTDEPLICLHINSFANGTLVSLTYPHLVADAMGSADLVQAWAHVVQTQNVESLELQFKGAHEDIVASVGTDDDKIAKDTKFVLEDRETRGLSLVSFLAGYILDTIIDWDIQSRHIYMPANFVTHLRNQAVKEWELTHGTQNGPVPFVSDGDLITAWGSRMVLASAKRGSAVICNVFDVRGRLDFIKSNPALRAAAYFQNLILPSNILLTAKEARNLSAAQIAFRVRKAIVEQTSDTQVRSLMRMTRVWLSWLGTMPFFMSWNTTRVIASTNWSKARFLERADLGASATESKGKTGSHSLKPVLYWGGILAVTDKPRDAFIIYGKDHDGDYWLHAYLRKETWSYIQKELDNFAEK
ncbi:hypothetical protein F5Y12DRAFT_777224 [Xylaria sp. FL1777]|nr:hypothetical protein F5Y12DRAFT_777224 [Xylaria sp. FL1777]